jgi:hypothetical protein
MSHEESDASGASVLRFYAGLFLIVLGTLAMSAWLYFSAPRIQSIAKSPPPEPRVQEDATTYAWVDRAQGVVRIPVTQAMKRMVETHAQVGR